MCGENDVCTSHVQSVLESAESDMIKISFEYLFTCSVSWFMYKANLQNFK